MTTRDKLQSIAINLWWSWSPDARSLFRRLNPEVFRTSGNNPQAALALAQEEVLDDADFQAEVDEVYDRYRAYMDREPEIDAPNTAYFCMEYGIHESLSLYSGGLGVLAGDHAKAASDLGLPFTGIGLFLREGYFDQSFNANGWQQSTYPVLDPAKHPLSLVTGRGESDALTVTVHIGTQPVQVRAWKLALGHTDLYLLDTDFDANPDEYRPLTRRLYQGGNYERIRQELILGIGGLRLLRALDVEPEVYHANEGHCAFLMLELLRERLDAGDDLDAAEQWVRNHSVFTTHTPVMAGHDHFDPALFSEATDDFQNNIALDNNELLSYGRVNPDDPEETFTMTVLGLKLSRAANGVSKLNGHVARQQWEDLYPDRALNEIPIDSITNGVHLPTWTAGPTQNYLPDHLDGNFTERHDPAVWNGLEAVGDEELWAYRGRLRRRLLDFIEAKVQGQSLPMHPDLDPEALTIGFARRFATYKRAPLLFRDRERARALFTNPKQPLQLIYAGKAHPADDAGKKFIQRIYELSQMEGFEGKVIFLENYDMEIGRMLVSGCDVWLNNPRRPLEASGTSGQKVAAHGGLNLSVLDGWWPEGYTGSNGWAIGPEPTGDYGETDSQVQDEQDAASLYEQLEEEVIPTFYDRTPDGIPTEWVAKMREAMTGLPAPFSAKRMVVDYVEEMYRNEE